MVVVLIEIQESDFFHDAAFGVNFHPFAFLIYLHDGKAVFKGIGIGILWFDNPFSISVDEADEESVNVVDGILLAVDSPHRGESVAKVAQDNASPVVDGEVVERSVVIEIVGGVASRVLEDKAGNGLRAVVVEGEFALIVTDKHHCVARRVKKREGLRRDFHVVPSDELVILAIVACAEHAIFGGADQIAMRPCQRLPGGGFERPTFVL